MYLSKSKLVNGCTVVAAGLLAVNMSSGTAYAQDGNGKIPSPAQTAPPSSGPHDSKGTTTVTVKGKKPVNKIDRQVYDVSKDPDSQTGSAADALNKLPGVAVDAAGTVTLRGKSPKILLNGHPSLLLSGDNRGIALQAMPSSYIQSIEVINNPGAEFSGGSTGIINIITKRQLPPGQFGTEMVKLSSAGGGQANIYDQFHYGKITATALLFYLDGEDDSWMGSDLRQLDGSKNVLKYSERNARSHTNINSFPSFTGSIDYDLTPNDTLSAGLNYQKLLAHNRDTGRSALYDSSERATDIYDSVNSLTSSQESSSLTGDWVHYGKKSDETFKVHASLSRQVADRLFMARNDYALSSVPSIEGSMVNSGHQRQESENQDLSADYKTPVGDDQLSLGAEFTHDNNDAGNQLYGPDPVGVSTPTLNTQLTNEFKFQQTVSAAYVTYQKEIGERWTVLGGVRVEALSLHTDQISSGGATGRLSYTKFTPSLYATYLLSNKSKLRFSYSNRFSRPNPQDVNPALSYVNSNNVIAGNPRLRPQETNSFEAGYEYNNRDLNWTLRAFHSDDQHYIVFSSFYIPDPQKAGNLVLETTRSNAGAAQSTGVETTYNDRLWKKLTLNASLTLSQDTIRNPEFSKTQSATPLIANLSANYMFKSNDMLSLRYKVVGKHLSGEGYSEGYGLGTLVYSHALTKKLRLLFDISDAFRTGKTKRVTDTPFAYGELDYSRRSPVFGISLVRQFGGFKTIVRH